MTTGSYFDFQLACVRETHARRDLHLNVIENTRGLDSMMLAIQNETFGLLSQHLRGRLHGRDLDKRHKFAINYYTHATANIIVDWVRDDHGLTAEELTAWLLDCMPEMLKEALGAQATVTVILPTGVQNAQTVSTGQ